MKYTICYSEAKKRWGVRQDGHVIEWLSTSVEADAMIRGLEYTFLASLNLPEPAAVSPETSSVTYSGIGTAELQVKFDGPLVRIAIEHDGDDEIALTKRRFRQMLSMWQAMADAFQ